MSSKPKETKKETTTNSSVNPLGEQAPFFSNLWAKTGTTLNNTGNPFTGDIIAAPSSYSLNAPGMIANAPVGGNAMNTAEMARKVASGYFLDPSNDPTFAAAASAAIDPVTRQLQEKILPGIVDRSIRVGGTGGGPAAYGGASQDLQENQAVRDWSKTAGDITATMANASRNAGLDLIKSIPSLNQGANAEALAPGQAAVTAGALDTANTQAILDNIFQKWNVNRTAPLQDLQSVASILSTGGFRNSNSTSNEVTTGPAPDMATQILQGLTGGAGIVSSLFGKPQGGESAWNGLTSAASSILPAIMAISDRRLKHGIKEIGKTPCGLGVYMYHFAGTGRTEVGFMADEVEKVYPEAVTEICGLKTVDYGKIRELMEGAHAA